MAGRNQVCSLTLRLARAAASLAVVLGAAALAAPSPAADLNSSYDMKVLVIKFLHIDQSDTVIDDKIAPEMLSGIFLDFDSTVASVDAQVTSMKQAAENGSAYLKYRTSTAQPALRYNIVDTKTLIQAVPFRTDGIMNYELILTDVDPTQSGIQGICEYVDYQGVREVWILKGRHEPPYHGWESLMQGPIVIISNPSSTENAPLCKHSYRIYTHEYNREDLFPEVWSHQIEAELEHVSRSGNGPDLFRYFNAPCWGNGEYGCAPRETASAGLTGEYFDNMTLTGEPTFTRTDGFIDFDWQGGSPDPSLPAQQFPADGFSVRWTGQVVPEDSDVTFVVVADDGVRLRVNGQTVIDQWVDQDPTEHSGRIVLTANQPYPITMEYYENGGGALAKLRWRPTSSGPTEHVPVPQSRLSPTPTGYVGQYFNNTTLANPPALTRTDPTINFSWGVETPDPAIGTDCDGGPGKECFSARWTGQFVPKFSELYDFYTITDDGVRLWVGGQPLINQWILQPETQHSGQIALVANEPYDIVMEYFENTGLATARLLQWRSPSTNKHQAGRCGNAHTGPNGRSNYDRSNTDANPSDCQDWDPNGIGPLSAISCSNWVNGCGGETGLGFIFDNAVLNYTQWHWQNMPGRNNPKTYQGQQLRNWWDVHANFDVVMACQANKTLLMPTGQCQTDLGVAMFDVPDPVSAGGAGTRYSLTPTNYGPSMIAGHKVNVSLPIGSAYLNSAGECTAPAPTTSGLVITCDPGVLDDNQWRTFRLDVALPAVGTVTATATASIPDAFQDTAAGNNTVSITTTVTSVNGVDLFPTFMSGARASGSATKVSVGDAVKNQGSSRAGSFKIRYYLSTNATYESASDIVLASKSNGTGICERSLTSLNAGVISSVSGKTCYKPIGASNGVDYYVLVVDDATGTVTEYGEANNVMRTLSTIRW
jgi:hypothetical protein